MRPWVSQLRPSSGCSIVQWRNASSAFVTSLRLKCRARDGPPRFETVGIDARSGAAVLDGRLEISAVERLAHRHQAWPIEPLKSVLGIWEVRSQTPCGAIERGGLEIVRGKLLFKAGKHPLRIGLGHQLCHTLVARMVLDQQ